MATMNQQQSTYAVWMCQQNVTAQCASSSSTSMLNHTTWHPTLTKLRKAANGLSKTGRITASITSHLQLGKAPKARTLQPTTEEEEGHLLTVRLAKAQPIQTTVCKHQKWSPSTLNSKSQLFPPRRCDSSIILLIR
jgi:hypothetical protein